VIDHLYGTRDVISSTLVVPAMGAATREVAVVDDITDRVPRAAYLAADAAFNSPAWTPERDELAEALVAAAPHIRAHELEQLIRHIGVRASELPLLGHDNNAKRSALEDVVHYLQERKDTLEQHERQKG
jgi:hypothetical protein